MSRRLRALVPALVPALVVLACSDRPALSTGDVSASTGGEATADAPTSTSTTDGGATGASATDTADPGTGGSTTVDPPPGGCGPCDRTWVHDGNLEIGAASDLSQFACMTAVNGDLNITGDLSGEQLAPLCNLRKVEGWLSIKMNTLLTDLSPFSQLEETQVLNLWKLPGLTAVTGLTSLREVREIDIDETGATTLGSFSPQFTGFDTLHIYDNPALTDLSAIVGWGLKGDAQFVQLYKNPEIVDLTDLAELFAAAGPDFSFEMSDMSGLSSLAGLGAASQGHYQLEGLPLITDLAPLAAVTTLGSLRLSDMPLTSLAGLGSLQSASLSLSDMPLLTSLDGLGPLVGDGIHLRKLPLLGSLQGLEGFQSGSVSLIDLPLVDSLAPLGGFAEGQEITLYGLPLVTSLAGLDALESAFSLMIGDCINEGTAGMNGLTDLTGLGALTTADEFMVANSAKLTSLAGAEKLSGVASRLEIVNNAGLTQAAFDAFLAQVSEPEMTCFGGWDVCECIWINPP